ncbi:hypothetical protein G7Y89_g9713 [Cudoniella acicularis]|uniref:DUF6594 domain-containing protein n=1 Tax=Cudoniella acicularis TaxID=354080 RepID=A0A8H4RGD5_9HELO|nr:hypothetical protein G7Y89_g9713 [Cudoniella acicularis]
MDLEARLADTDHKDVLNQRLAQEVQPGDIQGIDDLTTRWSLDCGNADTIKTRKDLILCIDRKLREHHEFLVLQNKVFNLDEPETRVVLSLQSQLEERDPRYIQGISAKYLDDRQDLIALRKLLEKDPLTKLSGNMIYIPPNLIDGHDVKATYRYSERKINMITAGISASLAATLLFGSILGLHFITSEVARLVVVLVLTAVFAVLVKFTTTASRSEVFGGAAAFVAVLVVYVGGALSTGGAGSPAA